MKNLTNTWERMSMYAVWELILKQACMYFLDDYLLL